jgi:hypothetical protein
VDRRSLIRALLGAALVAAPCSCGSRTELDLSPLDAGDAFDAPTDSPPRDRVAVDRLLVRPDVVLRGCDGGALPVPGPVVSARATGRFGITAVFDPTTRRILSLGGSPSGGTRAAPPTSLDVDTGVSATLRLVGVSMLPIGAAAVWDARRSRAIVVGGRYPDGGFFSPGAGVLEVRVQGDAAVVTRLPDHPVGPVSGAAIAIDPERDALVMTGGRDDSAPPTTAYRATWSLRLGAAGARWERRAIEADGPPAGVGRQMGWDPELRRMVLVGGWVEAARDRRAWVLEGDRWRPVPGVLDAVPSSVTGLVWDARSCGFVMTVGNCSAELWLLRVRELPAMALLGGLTRDGGFRGSNGPALFLDASRDALLLLGGEDCQTSGFTYQASEQVPLRR